MAHYSRHVCNMSVFLCGVWIFYQKLIIPSISLSIVVALVGGAGADLFLMSVGIAYIVITPAIHYATYELKNPKEYYFYYNMGLSKMALWISTVVINFFVGLMLVMI